MTSSLRKKLGIAFSNATLWKDGKVLNAVTGTTADTAQAEMHLQFRNRVLGEDFPCVGGKSAIKGQAYKVATYGEMGSQEAADALLCDLDEHFRFFDGETSKARDLFITFAAIFPDTVVRDERHFHDLMWKQLQMLHNRDSEFYPWDQRVDSNIESDKFSYSIGEHAFFMVGMNPHSSRLSRQFACPAIVFNPGPQFEKIRELGIHASMKEAIRKRDVALQGSINPTLADFGEGNVALTYSGMDTKDINLCPFHFKNNS